MLAPGRGILLDGKYILLQHRRNGGRRGADLTNTASCFDDTGQVRTRGILQTQCTLAGNIVSHGGRFTALKLLYMYIPLDEILSGWAMVRVMFLLREGHIRKRQGRGMRASLWPSEDRCCQVEPVQSNTDKNVKLWKCFQLCVGTWGATTDALATSVR